MSRALALAERGRGRTSPNPMVGAVVVDGEGVVVGRGSHAIAGGPHAEVVALEEAGPRARGATLFCTLEPCSHVGRTPPCAPLVVRTGIRRAVIAMQDPNPLVAGKGLAHLRENGIDVEVGLLRAEAERLNAPFVSVMVRRRPFVTMKVALSRDRRVAGAGGERTPLTGPSANRWIHRDRAEVDAIGIGSGTLLADDPVLTPRGAYRARPLVRVVFDRSARTPPAARMLSTLEVGPIIVMAGEPEDAPARQRIETLRAAGASIEIVADRSSDAFIRSALGVLASRGVSSLILEGGPALHRAAWRAGIVDRIQIFTTPRTIGADGVPWLEESELDEADLQAGRTIVLGADVMRETYVHRAD